LTPENCICSVLGSVFVIGGLYLLLWGKRQEALQQRPKVSEHDREQQQQQVQLQPWLKIERQSPPMGC
jgi:hypothetical protein